MRFRYVVGCAVLTAVLLAPVSGIAAEAVHMTTPARNAALIPTVPAFKTETLEFYTSKRAITEGVVIRKSYIKDGKIIIPPSGVMYDSRMANTGCMTDSEMIILGKNYTNVNEEADMLVIKDTVMKKGEMIDLLPNGSRALHFQKGSTHGQGTWTAEGATFAILKSNGNYYGSTFSVNSIDPLQDISAGGFEGLGLATGAHSLDANAPEKLQYNVMFGNTVAVAGNSYLVAGKVTANEVEVKEFGTPMVRKVWISDKPVSGSYAVGDIVKVGDATVKVEALGDGKATISLTKDGKTQTREFTGFLDPKAVTYLPGTAADRAKFMMASEDDTVYVQVAVLNPKGVMDGDKIRLDMFSNVQSFVADQEWAADPRFVARPDTWAGCRALGEFFLENKEEIVLDATNNVLVGPEGYFKVVIDDFDGKKVNAWHFEDAEGNKTGNLAGFANGAHIDLVANFVDNGALGKFGYRTANNAFVKELNKGPSAMKK